MSREGHARAGAQAVVPEDQIVDIAVIEPRGSTMAGVIGEVARVALRGKARGVAGSMLAQHAHSASRGSRPPIVLASSESRPYALGRQSTGVVGGWKNLHPVAHIDSGNSKVNRDHSGAVRVIELTNATTGMTSEFEALNIGNLGIDGPLTSLGTEGS